MQDKDIREQFKEYIENNEDLKLKVSRIENHLIIDFKELMKFDPNLADALIETPEDFLENAEMVVQEMNGKKFPIRVKNFHINHTASLMISDKRESHLDKMWWFQGVVRHISEVRPLITRVEYKCSNCTNKITISQMSKILKKPAKCSCKYTKFVMVKCEKEDMMKIILEEDFEMLEGDEQPRRLNVILKKGLTMPEIYKMVLPGKKVIITGVLKDVPVMEKEGMESTERDYLLVANYIEPIDESRYTLEISKDDEELIRSFSKDEMIYQKLIDSVSPEVHGYRSEKLALILQSFGAVTKVHPTTHKILKRGKFHILLIGDPASAKSTIAKGLTRILPKSRYASGQHSTGAGLTWAAVKDEFIGSWGIEAGILVLASGGTAVIDELDKINKEERGKLNQALEHMSIDANKATIRATLKADTSIIGIANPKYGRFTPFNQIFDEFDLDPTLISRCALIFVFKDIPNNEKDEAVARHIFKTHSDTESIFHTELSDDFIKKYIMYAQNKCNPKLSEKLEKYATSKFLELRNLGIQENRMMITYRQFEDIIRLAEASARIRLSDVKEEDIDRAFGLMMYSLKQYAVDSTGKVDIDLIMMPDKNRESRSKEIVFDEIIKEMCIKDGQKKQIDVQDFVNRLVEKGFSEVEAEKWIEKKRQAGDVIEPRHGFIMVGG